MKKYLGYISFISLYRYKHVVPFFFFFIENHQIIDRIKSYFSWSSKTNFHISFFHISQIHSYHVSFEVYNHLRESPKRKRSGKIYFRFLLRISLERNHYQGYPISGIYPLSRCFGN